MIFVLISMQKGIFMRLIIILSRLSYFSKNCNEDELDINSDSTSTHSNPKDSFY